MVRFTDEAAALLSNEHAPHSLARWYAEQIRENNMVTARDVKRVYTAFRMIFEWETYKSAVLAGDAVGAYHLSNAEGVSFAATMDGNPSDKDIPEWIGFLDAVHGDCDWWSLIDDLNEDEF